MASAKIRVGLDFDGVVAYNPARLMRAPVTWFKRKVLGARKTKFMVPKSGIQKFIWAIIHKSSFFPAKGVNDLPELARNPKYELHLVTARFDFLKDDLYAWLEKQKIRNVFKSINTNDKSEQPHLFKERVLKELKLDYFVEDNLDIVTHLDKTVKTKVCWIYNFIDRLGNKRPLGFPYLKKALEYITTQKS